MLEKSVLALPRPDRTLDLNDKLNPLLRSGIESFDGKEMGANFYKCGDELPTPHFLSWNPIEWAEPSFHRPEQFGKLIFEQ